MFYRLETEGRAKSRASEIIDALAGMSALINRNFDDPQNPPDLGVQETFGLSVFLEMTANTLGHLSEQVATMEHELEQHRIAELKTERDRRDAARDESLKERADEVVRRVMGGLSEKVDADIAAIYAQSRGDASMLNLTDTRSALDLMVITDRQNGHWPKEIAAQYGISTRKVGRIIKKAKEQGIEFPSIRIIRQPETGTVKAADAPMPNLTEEVPDQPPARKEPLIGRKAG